MRSPLPALLAVSLRSLAGCAPEPTPDPVAPDAQLTIGVGFEDVTAGSARLAKIGRELDRVGARGVTIAVGRPDWTAFPWAAHPDAQASSATTDLVRAAIDALGADREVTLVIDVLAPRLLEEHPSEAAVDADGSRSDLFAGAAGYVTADIGDRIVELCGAVAERYRPDRVGLTELFLEDTFSDLDRALYEEVTGEDDWPRTRSGGIDTEHASIADFRSQVVADFVGRCDAAAAEHGVGVDMDVRAPWADPTAGRRESGHDYPQLLAEVDRLTVWNYFTLSDRPPSVSRDLTGGMREQLGDDIGRVTMSVGLWSGGAENQTEAHDSTVSPADMAEGVRASLTNGVTAVSVTPASRMTPEHWDPLARLGFRR